MNKKIYLILLINIFFVSLLNAQIGYRFLDVNEVFMGEKSVGLGGTGVASVTGANALAWNPANLSKLGKTEINLDLRYQYRTEFINSSQRADLLGLYNVDSVSWNNINNAAIAIPFKINHVRVVVGASYRLKNNWNAASKRFYNYEDEYGNDNYYAYSTVQKGGVRVLNFGISVRPISNFSFGVSYNKLYGNFSSTSAEYSTSSSLSQYEQLDINEYNLVGGTTTTYGIDSSRASYWEMGVAYNLFGWWNIGAKFNSPYAVREAWQNNYNEIDSFPLFYSVGSEIKLGEFYRFIIDYNKRDWSQVTEFNYTDSPPFPYSDNNLNTIHYGLILGDNYNCFRIGYYNKKYISNDWSDEANQLKSHVITAGFGFTDYERVVTWNVGFSYEFFYNRFRYNNVSLNGHYYTFGTDLQIYF